MDDLKVPSPSISEEELKDIVTKEILDEHAEELVKAKEKGKEKEAYKRLIKALEVNDSLSDKLRRLNPLKQGSLITGIWLCDDGELAIKQKPVKTGSKIEFREGAYQVQLDATVRYKGKPALMYFEGNPFPIRLNKDDHEVFINSKALYAMTQTNFIQGLFETGTGVTKTILWTAGTIMAVGLVAVLIISVFGGNVGTLLGMGG